MSKTRKKDEYTITFKEGALAKLRDLAWSLEVPPEKLGEVLEKGIKILDFAKDGKLIVEKYGTKFEVDLKKL